VAANPARARIVRAALDLASNGRDTPLVRRLERPGGCGPAAEEAPPDRSRSPPPETVILLVACGRGGGLDLAQAETATGARKGRPDPNSPKVF
jgi:hypothetical protein